MESFKCPDLTCSPQDPCDYCYEESGYHIAQSTKKDCTNCTNKKMCKHCQSENKKFDSATYRVSTIEGFDPDSLLYYFD